MELETAVRCKLPIVFIVNNNSGIVASNLEARMGLPEGYAERVATYAGYTLRQNSRSLWRSYRTCDRP